MEETTKITYIKNLDTFTFSTLITTPINSNVNIKKVINVDSYIFDDKIDTSSGKAIYSGKIGIKVLYVDTDNITNTLTDSQAFSETLVDSAITSETFVSVCNAKIFSATELEEGLLKTTSQITVKPMLYLNLSLPCVEHNFEHLVAKKSEIKTSTISQIVNTEFEYSTVFEAEHQISKILSSSSDFNLKSATAYDEYALIDGELFTRLIYETTQEGENKIMQANFSNTVKKELSLPGLSQNETLDLCFRLLCDKESITSEIEDEKSVVTITHHFRAHGVSLKEISLEVVDDMFSTENDLEETFVDRDYCCGVQRNTTTQNVFGDIDLQEVEPSINEVVATLNTKADVTNVYLKDNEVFVEGIVSACVVYLDDNNDYCSKQTELPFNFNTNIACEKLECFHCEITANHIKTRAKRSTTLEVEYELIINLSMQQKSSAHFVDGFTLGKPLDFSQYDYQIYIAKQDETLWELCKRTKIHPDDILKFNANLPPVCAGGERVVVKR